MNLCIMKDPHQMPFLPATEVVAKMNVEGCGSKYILGEATSVVMISGLG